MKYKLLNEDFIVEELYDFNELEDKYSENNKYAYYLMEKKNFNTMNAIMDVARHFKTTIKNIQFCGNKDKNAITKQIISICLNNRIEHCAKKEIYLGNNQSYIKLNIVGFFNKPVFLGAHKGNKFIITLKEISENELKKFNNNFKSLKKNSNLFINFFGEQRFSTNNVIIGKYIIQKKFKEAFETITSENTQTSKILIKNLSKNDFVNTIRKIPLKNLSLYVNAYQSQIWNEIAIEYDKLINYKYNIDIPIIGFDLKIKEILEEKNNAIISTSNTKKKIIEKEIECLNKYQEKLKNEGIDYNDFVIKQIPQISACGTFRKLYETANKLEILDIKEQEDNNEIKISFELNKSCYATTLINQLFK